jgi:hypothetical protein
MQNLSRLDSIQKHVLLLLLAALVLHSAAMAESLISVGAGWRMDHLDWSIAGPDNEPNILSELEWKDVEMWQVSGKMAADFFCDWYLKVSGDYGKIYSGKNIDSDFGGNNRTKLFLRSTSEADRGEAFDLSVGIGYPLDCFSDCVRIIPLIGYAYSQQNLTMRKGFITINFLDDVMGRFPGLHSHYRARWVNGWLGFDFTIPLFCDRAKLFGTAEIHTSSFHGTGHWNLRSDFVGDFDHHAKGWGYYLLGGGECRIWSSFFLGAQVSFFWMQASNGSDTTQVVVPIFDPLGNVIAEEVVEARTKLNSVNWHSIRVSAILSYEF